VSEHPDEQAPSRCHPRPRSELLADKTCHQRARGRCRTDARNRSEPRMSSWSKWARGFVRLRFNKLRGRNICNGKAYSTRIPKGIKARSKNQRAAVASVNGAGLDAAVVAARQIMRISRRDPRRPSRLAALFTATYPERCAGAPWQFCSVRVLDSYRRGTAAVSWQNRASLR
jgi:hypothetical protein